MSSPHQRRPILAANWKMQKGAAEATAFAAAFLPLVAGADSVDIVIAPPFTALDRLGQALSGSAVALAAQNVNPEASGAFTGEIAVSMLRELGCGYGVVGHSERRALYRESSDFVAAKAEALLAAGIRPIVCVGETLEEREADRAEAIVAGQLEASLARIPQDRAAEVVVAYEPVWAIGTGKTATPEMAQAIHAFIRERLRALYGATAELIRIQYGGSVKPENVRDIMSQDDIDGALVGGASLDPASFARIVLFQEPEATQ
jgi:triosephosphate isomerase